MLTVYSIITLKKELSKGLPIGYEAGLNKIDEFMEVDKNGDNKHD